MPAVDAGMRQLWWEGWLSNRARFLAAAFLTKHLLLDWRAGEAWFWDTLVDACPANPGTPRLRRHGHLRPDRWHRHRLLRARLQRRFGPRPVRMPLSIEGGGFGLRDPHACPEILPPGGPCEVEVVSAPIAVGQAPGCLRAGAPEAAPFGVVPETRLRAEVIVHAGAEGWEEELRNTSALAFVAPAAFRTRGSRRDRRRLRRAPLAPGAILPGASGRPRLRLLPRPVARFGSVPL